MRILQGYLHTIVEMGSDGCQHGDWFESLEGEWIRVEPRANTPREQLIEAYIDNGRLIHFNLLVAEWRDRADKHVALMRVLIPGEEETQRHHDEVEQAARFMETEYRRRCKGQWDVHITPYVLTQYPYQRNVMGANWNWLRERIDGQPYLHGWGGTLPGGILGHAFISGGRAWTAGHARVETLIHEQGHCFGLNHSGTPTNEYGERGSYMASGGGRNGFTAPHQRHLDWIDPEAVYQLDADSSAIVYLISADSDAQARDPGVFKAIAIQKGYRGGHFVGIFHGTLRMYTSEAGGSFSKTTMIQEHSLGHRHILGGDESTPELELIDIRNGIYKVRVAWSQGMTAPDQPWPVPVVADDAVLLTSEHSGIYWQTELDGQGFDCWFLDDQTVAYWYTYNDRGEPLWYLLQGGSPDGKVRHVDILEASVGLRKLGTATFTSWGGKIRMRYLMGDEHGVLDLSMLAKKGPESRLAAFTNRANSGVSTTGDVGYIYQIVTRIQAGRVTRRMEWLLLDGGEAYMPKGGAFRVASTYELRRFGPVEITGDTLTLAGETFELEDLV